MRLLAFRKHFFVLLMAVISMNSHGQANAKALYEQSAKLFKVGNYAEALNSSIQALKLIEAGSDMGAIAYANIHVGRMYYFLHDKRLALKYFFKSRQIIRDHAIDSLQFKVNYNIGVIYTEIGVSDSALLFYNDAFKALDKEPDNTNYAKLYSVIADLHLNCTHDLVLAKYNIDKAEKYAEKANDPSWKAFVYIKYSIYYKYMKDYAQCIRYARLASQIYESIGELDGRMYGTRVLADALALNGDPKAKETYEKLMILKDSIFGVETANKIAGYKTIYETEKKETENKLLQQQNKLSLSEIDAKNKTIIGLSIGALLIIITAFWRISAINLKKKQRELEASQAVQKEKERISRDLHDNVGGQLSYVLYSLDGINDVNNPRRSQLATDINESIRNVIGNLRETIWAISDQSITANDLSDKLKVYIRTMFRNTNTNVVFNENILVNLHLNAITGLNLYRICQEITNNAFKYSEASEFKIEINVKENIKITIGDNGKGFDPKEIPGGHFGLSNIKARGQEAGIEINLTSEINKGTTYTIVV